MIETIPITTELRDYIERLHYESVRYADLLNTVRRDMCPMTDEEWESSKEYYQGLCRDAQASMQYAMDTLYELYGDIIGQREWRVDFRECAITIGKQAQDYKSERDESYIDQISRLYPVDNPERLHINDIRGKDITLQVTDACNMACTYCYQHNKGHHSMPFEVGKAFIDMLLDADERTNEYITSTKCQCVIINFIGGEPWLEVDLISKLSDYFIGELFRRKHPWAIKFMFSICSNGLLHFDERVQAYIRRHGQHLGYSISIDGGKDLHDSCRVDLAGNGTYDRAMAAVEQYWTEFHGTIGSKMTIAPGNVDKVADAVEDMIEHGYKMIHLNCVYEEGWTNDHAKTLYWQLHSLTDWLIEHNLQDEVELSIFSKICGHPMHEEDNQNWCGGVGFMLAVDYKGDIYPCLRYMESSVGSNQPAYIIGNVYDGIRRLPEHRQRVACLECVTRRSQSTDECWYCPIAQGCGWCSAYNYECFGTPNARATFICCMHKARALANVYYWRRRGVEYSMDCPKSWAVEIIGQEEYEKLLAMKTGGEGYGNN